MAQEAAWVYILQYSPQHTSKVPHQMKGVGYTVSVGNDSVSNEGMKL